MYKFKNIIIIIIGLTFCVSCNNNSKTKIELTGSSTVAPLIMEIGRRFERLNPHILINVQTGGSSRGINDIKNNLSNIGMISRELKDNEAEFTEHTIAWDGITVILHKENNVKQLSHQDVLNIFTGKIKNWQKVGGVNKKIVVINKAEGRSTLELFLKHFGMKNSDVEADIIVGDNQQGLNMVAGSPLSIGYVSIGAAIFEAENGMSVKLIDIDGLESKLSNVRNGTFPILRPLNLVTRGQTSKEVMEFINFAQSAAVSDVINQHYFVSTNANK
ncbi:phosphate ABC transporter substrate-binding protein [Psychromonas sp. Urea-02u-13]|uniref:phosphate ABC transporter substrate-binding protein n=1 Tax=Psychromonas sp. Urea-02u-13 TaxID=2058326 RepID=UPI000C34C873|nr:phosphate ABC transporter substrate-binding protein [Psychromonas sp. Urea-02u-13]PKG37884.1 ABC transporter substrate-binding protein [Psychromonas sp. Urea-02u-13]